MPDDARITRDRRAEGLVKQLYAEAEAMATAVPYAVGYLRRHTLQTRSDLMREAADVLSAAQRSTCTCLPLPEPQNEQCPTHGEDGSLAHMFQAGWNAAIAIEQDCEGNALSFDEAFQAALLSDLIPSRDRD